MGQLLSVADAARLLGVVPATVRQMERAGILAAERTAGGMRLFHREDVDRLVEERKTQRAAFAPGSKSTESTQECPA